MNTKAYDHDVITFVGRFQPLHQGHVEVMLEGLQQANRLIVAVGSARSPRSYRNPFTFDERKTMIVESIKDIDPALLQRLTIIPLVDMHYNDEQWIKNVQQSVYDVIERDQTVSLIGHAKDASSFYLNMFPTWRSVRVQNYKGLSATPMRNAYFSNIAEMWLKNCDGHKVGDLPGDRLVPTAVKKFLEDFIKTQEYRYVCDEYDFVARYQKPYLGLPYPPTFVTVDACVVQSGHVLLVKRRTHPGKGLWALPGGFLNHRETIAEGTVRELYEETDLKLHERILRGSAKMTKCFDDPHRSARGRTLTHATLFYLERRSKLPEIRGMDDAEEAMWWPLAKVEPEMMFDDHDGIIRYLTGSL